MSIETELKAFNGLFEQFIKAEQEKTNAISKLADAVISAYSDNEKLRMHSAPAAVLNEAKVAKVSSEPLPEPTQEPEAEKVEETGASATATKTSQDPTQEQINEASKAIRELCNSLNRYFGGKSKVIEFIKTFGYGDNTKAFPYEIKLKFIEFASQKLQSLEASHA